MTIKKEEGMKQMSSHKHLITQSSRIEKGDVRKAFERVFTQGQNYVLFQTSANPDAVEALHKYCASRKNMESPWEIRSITSDDTPNYVPGARDHNNGLKLGHGLMHQYEYVVNTIAEKIIGNNNFAQYQLINTLGIHEHDKDPHEIFWPRVYLVNKKKENELKDILKNLTNDASLELLTRISSPQHYYMAEITTLHNLKINPITRLEPELRVNGKNLKRYIDFIVQTRQIPSPSHHDFASYD